MTAVAPQAAVSWSSVAKNVGPRCYAAGGFLVLRAPQRFVARSSAGCAAPPPYPPPLAGEGREGGVARSLAGVRLDGRGAVPETEGEG